MSDTERLTWEQMIAICPALEDLRDQFHTWAAANDDVEADTMAWPRWVKPIMRDLVGWYTPKWSRDHFMRSHMAWDIAFKRIFLDAPKGTWYRGEE